jgi:hypothetical protein
MFILRLLSAFDTTPSHLRRRLLNSLPISAPFIAAFAEYQSSPSFRLRH